LTRRAAARAALVCLALPCTVLALGPPRLTWQNAGLRVDHPPYQGAAALLAAALVMATAVGARPRAAAAIAFAAAAGLATLGAQRLAWRVEAIGPGLRQRTLAGWTRIAWPDVVAVEPLPGAVRVRAPRGDSIEVATRGLGTEDRMRLERTIARRVREAAPSIPGSGAR
jgi:hypothetical protein